LTSAIGATNAAHQTATAPIGVDPRSITARASSELPPTQGLTYSIRNTLDRDGRTAWNNYSAVRGSGVGETLTYRFAHPLHLARIELINGYAKTAQLYAANGRIRGVDIITDRRTFQATLSDTVHRQRLDRDFGLTQTVTLRVTSIYPGAAIPTSPSPKSRFGQFRGKRGKPA
jgi:Nicotine adenine dinucleotide glycohydrolase (NADase)